MVVIVNVQEGKRVMCAQWSRMGPSRICVDGDEEENTEIGTCQLCFCGKGKMENCSLRSRLVFKGKNNIS